MDEIYYVFRKDTGEYAGSGTPYFDDNEHGCTQVPTPAYNADTQIVFWNSESQEWSVTERGAD